MDGPAPSLGMSDTHRPLPQALAGPPVTHTFSPQSTKYIFLKKPQHNRASCEGPGEARAWPPGAADGACGRHWKMGNSAGPLPAECAVCPLLVSGWGLRYPVPVATHLPRQRKGDLEMSHVYVPRPWRGSCPGCWDHGGAC